MDYTFSMKPSVLYYMYMIAYLCFLILHSCSVLSEWQNSLTLYLQHVTHWNLGSKYLVLCWASPLECLTGISELKIQTLNSSFSLPLSFSKSPCLTKWYHHPLNCPNQCYSWLQPLLHTYPYLVSRQILWIFPCKYTSIYFFHFYYQSSSHLHLSFVLLP